MVELNDCYKYRGNYQLWNLENHRMDCITGIIDLIEDTLVK